MEECFHKALWEYKRNTHSISLDHIKKSADLYPYLDTYEAISDPEILTLLELWKEEIFKDNICDAALKDYQLTGIHRDIRQIREAIVVKQSEPAPKTDFKRNQDLKTLTRLMEAFSFPLLDKYCLDDPTYIDTLVVACYDAWTYTMIQSTFRIHDEELRKTIESFYTAWKEVIKFGEKWYSPAGDGTDRYKFFGFSDFYYDNPEARKAFSTIVMLHQKLYPLLKQMADYIMDNFEIDLDALALKEFN